MEIKENVMGTKKIFPLMMTMSIPPMVSMLIQSMYNIVDSFYVAKMGEGALTAVSLAFPLQNIALAVAVGIGVSLNSCISRSLGAKDTKAISSVSIHAFILTAVHSLILVAIGLFLAEPFISAFTKDPEIISMGTDYLSVVICLSFGMQFHIYIEKMFQAVGNMFVPMCLQGLGAVINIVLDPILIFGKFGFPQMGVKGAAVATVVGQLCACLCSIIIFAIKKPVHISPRDFSFSFFQIKKLYGIAIPSTLMMAMPSLLISVLNGILASISQTAVAVFGLYFKLQSFIYMPSSGLVQGMRPIIGYNFGAKNTHRLKETLKCAIGITGVVMCIGTAVALMIPEKILMVFNSDETMLSMGVPMLRILSLCFIPSTISVVFSGAFEALGKGVRSFSISMIRQLVIVVPLAFILSRFIGATGVWIAFPIAEVVACVVAVILMKSLHLFPKKGSKSKLGDNAQNN